MFLPSRILARLLCLVPLLSVAMLGCAQPAAPVAGGGGDYLFCFWNVENFFDDRVNGWKDEADQKFDRWFGEDRAAFRQKVHNLVDVLGSLNHGKGPDILALAEVEVESEAMKVLMERLNFVLQPNVPPYRHLLMKNPHGGRNIATAILTRLPVAADRTRLLGSRQRILEGHIEVNGRDLTVLATHWTSRVSDSRGDRRAKYADQIHGRFRALYKADPDVSLLVCGDFNDNPDDASVREHLHATGDLARVREGGDPPLLYDLFAPLWEESKVGTHFYRGKPFLFDQIAVSPGMVNGKGGWQCEVPSAVIVQHLQYKKKGRPLPFGSPRDKLPLSERGASDHLPVTVRLRVNG